MDFENQEEEEDSWAAEQRMRSFVPNSSWTTNMWDLMKGETWNIESVMDLFTGGNRSCRIQPEGCTTFGFFGWGAPQMALAPRPRCHAIKGLNSPLSLVLLLWHNMNGHCALCRLIIFSTLSKKLVLLKQTFHGLLSIKDEDTKLIFFVGYMAGNKYICTSLLFIMLPFVDKVHCIILHTWEGL